MDSLSDTGENGSSFLNPKPEVTTEGLAIPIFKDHHANISWLTLPLPPPSNLPQNISELGRDAVIEAAMRHVERF